MRRLAGSRRRAAVRKPVWSNTVFGRSDQRKMDEEERRSFDRVARRGELEQPVGYNCHYTMMIWSLRVVMNQLMSGGGARQKLHD